MSELIPFTVDSALLQELGERLVGAPHIALAELIKNAYDADATEVVIAFSPDQIEVRDNGHGMTRAEFVGYWMRVGSTHKDARGVSPKFERPLTGSKGVGRLAAQFLAKKLRIRTGAVGQPGVVVEAEVNWTEAVRAGELTEATALVDEKTVANGTLAGTTIALTGLNQTWTPSRFAELAREIWPLQPPFHLTKAQRDTSGAFEIKLEANDPELTRRFREQMDAVLTLWQARLVGSLVREGPGGETVHLTLEFDDRTRQKVAYRLPIDWLKAVDFEIRVFDLRHRQPFGIRVDEARRYLREFGGVHMYDAGFHLPYYGPDSDWLRVEIDHSHRLSRSRLLPDEFQVQEGLNNLPTNSRLYGVVHVNTAVERRSARDAGRPTAEALSLQVSRDRLQDNEAYRQLVDLVRWALDYYAMQVTLRAVERTGGVTGSRTAPDVSAIADVIERHSNEIPAPVKVELEKAAREEEAAATASQLRIRAQSTLLAALATAGISALAYEHEVRKQLDLLTNLADGLREETHQPTQQEARRIAAQIDSWVERASATRKMFTHLLDEGPRTTKKRYGAKSLIADVADSIAFLLRPIKINVESVQEALRLPEATYADWAALVQNVLINAANAIVVGGSTRRSVDVSSRRQGSRASLLFQDAGTGVDLSSSEELFQPFVRRLPLPPSRAALGLGGSGLGLTIVRMISDGIGVRVRFVEPTKPYKAAVEVSWVES
jgi:signal transduction histidine kinase